MGIASVIQGIVDTSVLMATDRQSFEERQGNYAISVLSVVELHKGAIRAKSARERAARIARLAVVEQTFEVVPIDRRIAVKFGEIAATTLRLANRPHVIDGLIAATAIVLGVPVEVARLRGAGVRFRNDIVTGPGGKQIVIEDPSGNPVELFQPADR